MTENTIQDKAKALYVASYKYWFGIPPEEGKWEMLHKSIREVYVQKVLTRYENCSKMQDMDNTEGE